jgi:hypothetical protein
MSWLVLPPAIYQILTGENILEPNTVSLILLYLPNGSQTENDIYHSHPIAENKELHDQMVNTNKALIAIAKA